MALNRMFHISEKLEKMCIESGRFDKKHSIKHKTPQPSREAATDKDSNEDKFLHPQYKTPKYLHIAALIKKNNIVSVGYNHFIKDSRNLPTLTSKAAPGAPRSYRGFTPMRKPRFRVL